MSHIDDLIDRLCPNGVEFRPLGDCVVRNLGGGTPSRSRPEYWDGGIPWASVGDLTATSLTLRETRQHITEAGFRGSSTNLIPEGWVVVAVKIAPGAMRVVEREVAINQDIRGLRLADALDPYFVAYYFQTLSVVGNGTIVKGITTAMLERIVVPVPPLEVQREIVRTLDQFTQLEAELEAELEARRLQYAHYSSQLLSSRANSALHVSLGDATSLILDRRGITPKKLGSDWTRHGHRVVSALNLKDGGVDRNDHHYIDDATYIKWMSVPLQANDVLLTSEAPLGAVAFLADDVDWALGQRLFALRPRRDLLDGRFLYHLLRAGAPRRDLLARATGSTVSGIRQSELVKVRLDLPDIPEQRRVVMILDQFGALVNDLSIGLPAELAARRKQYEYYRDKLLTFKEAG